MVDMLCLPWCLKEAGVFLFVITYGEVQHSGDEKLNLWRKLELAPGGEALNHRELLKHDQYLLRLQRWVVWDPAYAGKAQFLLCTRLRTSSLVSCFQLGGESILLPCVQSMSEFVKSSVVYKKQCGVGRRWELSNCWRQIGTMKQWKLFNACSGGQL